MSSILPGQFAAHYLFAETVIQDSSDCANGGSCVDQKCTIHEFMSVIEEYQVNSNDPNIADPNPVKTVEEFPAWWQPQSRKCDFSSLSFPDS